MKNRRVFILILMFVITGFAAFPAYAQNPSGTFTLTDIPASFNGMKAHVEAYNSVDLIGAIIYTAEDLLPSTISHGRVTLPMWLTDSDGNLIGRYSGSHTAEVEVFIYNDDYSFFIEVEFGPVQFSNGSASKSFNDATAVYYD